jgi:endonuclease/exonuclease/phosphatase family metal-dependent hydrolase
VLLLPWLAWAVVRAGGLEGGSAMVPAMAFTPYLAATAWVPVVVALALRRWAVAVVGAVAFAVLVSAVLPRTLAGPRPDIVGGVPLRLMTANLFEGRGDARTVVDLVRRERVDVLALEELPAEEVRRLDAAGLRRLLPYRDVDARPGAAGTGLFSRLPLRRLTPPPALTYNGAPRVLVQPAGASPVDVQAVHPPPPLQWRAIWRQMLAAIPPAGDGAALRVVLGDFNATLDHHDLLRVLDRGYVDAGDATGEGLRTTWPAGRRLPPELTIDHVLADRRIAARTLSVHLVPHSDHRAVVAQLELPRGVAR